MRRSDEAIVDREMMNLYKPASELMPVFYVHLGAHFPLSVILTKFT